MDPTKAARVIATLETELAVDILANMKQKSAGKILNNLEGEKAATLSVAFSTLQ
jgi:flagellar motility protein MotE (MotC chaperone)